MSNASLIAHVDCSKLGREDLLSIPTPVRRGSHYPVAHWDLVQEIHQALAARGLGVAREEYAVGGASGAKLFGTLALAGVGEEVEGTRFALGVRHGNDKSMSLQMVAAANVFVCDNMAFSGSGDAIKTSRKHTRGLHLPSLVGGALDRFLDGVGRFRRFIERMQNHSLTDDRAKALIFDAVVGAQVLPQRLMPEVARLYFRDDEQHEKHPGRSLFVLNNAFTEAVKALPFRVQQQAGPQIGEFFQRALEPRRTIVIDGIEGSI